MKTVVEDLFQEILERTEALLDTLRRSSIEEMFEEELDSLLKERESILLMLRDRLEQEPDPDLYRYLYERYKKKEALVVQLLKTAKEELARKMREAQQNRTLFKQYDAYLRNTPYGVFFDKKK